MAQSLFEQRLAEERLPIEAALERALARLPKSVRLVAGHILLAGGKRLRPFLTVICARLFGQNKPDIYDLAVSMEMLHAASLLHDDVLDNATCRRGKKAAHTSFGVAKTILAGDALLAQGNAQVAAFGQAALCTVFSDATVQTAAGEILEIDSERNVALSEADYLRIARGKTACLIRASCELGAIAAQAGQRELEKIASYGEDLGLAFQLVDDALDFAPSAQTGKPSGGDMREGRFTPPLRLYRMALSPEECAVFDAAFACGFLTEEDATEIARRVREAGYDRLVREEADQYLRSACAALTGLPEKPEREILFELADYVRERKH